MQKGTLYMDYGLWLLTDPTGRITLTGWAETSAAGPDPDAPGRTDHWPTYDLCESRDQLPARLQELGLDLAPGADLNDLDKAWDVNLRHPDIAALKSALDRQRTAQ
ncbi:hypothetical protein BEL07_20630 [Mycolicibacterium grossiae]|uniref:Uncharacterized protein n=1 Tax=Mycolicibacterium grossiae TaxID=1552759 RepID=A0A1E8Q0C2_9MYCO|nr:hypothetical protein [Mycolicibacterium grossiae]OFJ51867.1 hypothetical protein BEL07_20630 [Mycolicibacterium grossiae]